MCIIERFNLIHPNGAPERKEHFRYCRFGSPHNPCNNTRIDFLPDTFVPWPDRALGVPHQVEEIEPRVVPKPSRQEEKRRFKRFSNNLKLVWDFHIPFTSAKSDKKNRPAEHVFVRERGSQRRRDVQDPMRPEGHMQPPYYGPPLQGGPVILEAPDGHQQPIRQNPEPQVIRTRRNHPLNLHFHHAGDSSSPSPPTPLREHRRHHSLTPPEVQRYEELKREVSERERRGHVDRQRCEQAERHARKADEMRLQAEREAERLRRQNLDLKREERRRLDREKIRMSEEWERQRQEHEEVRERRIRFEEQRRLESAQQERWRQEQEDYEREHARRRQEREDRQRLQEEVVRERMRRDQNERDRIERQRRAGIPHRPRHETVLHHRPHMSFEETGDQVIDDAIRRGNQRRFETRAPSPPRRAWSRRRDVGGGHRRRDTIVYEDDRRRGGRRFI